MNQEKENTVNKVIDMSNYFKSQNKDKDVNTVVEKPIGSEQLTSEDLMEELEDAFLMGKQEAVYQSVATFLSTPEAAKNNIIGVEIIIENGYINCYWKFGERGNINGR